MGRQTFICNLGYEPGMKLTARPATTPECEPHTPWPAGYIASSDYADLMLGTHNCRACKGCGLYLIWTPKPNARSPFVGQLAGPQGVSAPSGP